MTRCSIMRSLFGLLLLLSYSSHAFTVHSSNTGLLFGGKHATFRHQSLPRAQQHVPLNQPSLLTHASSRIANNNKIVELNACRSVGDNSGASTNVITRIKSWIATFRKTTKALLFGAFLAFACFIESASAVSGGRMGGSFSPSSSRSSGSGTSHSMHRSSGYRSSGYSRGYSQGFAPRTHIFAPSIRLGHPSYYPTRLFHSATSAAPVRRFGVADAVLLGGTGYVLYSAFARSKSGSDSTTALGEGTSVASITLSLTVPDRDDFYSILNKLKRLSESADTSTRQGVQTLVSSVAMELLREESSITSAKTTSSHFNNPNQAEREFQRISVQERSKFDKETVNKYGGMDVSQIDVEVDDAIRDKATEAVVTISLSIQGDQTELPEIRDREDLKYALTRIAADAPVEDCLNSAEILWSPELRSERLTRKEIFADHPDLYPL